MSSNHSSSSLTALIVGGFIVLSSLSASNMALAAQDEASKAEARQMLAQYETAMADGDKVEAVHYLLDYSEETYGENSPITVKLTHRYGKLLYEDGDYRKATSVLKTALKRSVSIDGEFGGAAFGLNMNIGYAYSKWHPNLSQRTRYFDRGLEVLRKDGKHESIIYITTLVNIITNMMDKDGLKGSYSSTISENIGYSDFDGDPYSIEREYYTSFHKAKKYVLEAVALAKKLSNLDEYLSSKIAIAQAKLNVMETADLSSVPMGVEGYISGGTEKENYDREEERLKTAINNLSKDIEQNSVFLSVANKVRMEIAWMRKDNDRMTAMCADGTLNVASDYPPENLFEIMEGGMVAAPAFGFKLSRNIFKPRVVRGGTQKDKNGMVVRRPHFVPVCINGELMAALVNAPRVIVEEVE